MEISGLNKVTLQDYPGKMACIIFTQGCNMRCPFCQNSTLTTKEKGLIDENEIFEFLNKRKNILDGVVISGGEPTIQEDLYEFIEKVKNLGLKVKLDTNGIRYDVLKKLIDNNLVDYVAMDVKNIMSKYGITSGIKNIYVDNIKKSMEILKKSNIEYEFRTTLIKEHHTIDDIKEMINLIGDGTYYLQNFKISDNVIDKSLHGFSDEELKMINKEFEKYKNVYVRGV